MKRLFPLLLALGAFLAPAAAFAQAAAGTPNQAIFPQTAHDAFVQLCAATVTGCANVTVDTNYTLFTAGPKGSICKGLFSTNNDPSATHLISVSLNNGTTTIPLVALLSVSSAGVTTGTPAQALMTNALWPGLPLDQNGNPYFYMINGDSLAVQYHTAFTAGKALTVIAICSDF